MYRNVYGELFFVRFDLDSFTAKLWAMVGGVFLGEFDQIDERSTHDILRWIEGRSRLWTTGFVPCADCNTVLTRFSRGKRYKAAIAGSYHAGRYCRSCWPKHEARSKEVD